MIIQGNIGPIGPNNASLGTGVATTIRLGNMGDSIVSELHGRYYEAAYRRTMFSAALQAATVTSAGLIASGSPYTGLSLVNPANNTNNLVLNKVGVAFPVAPAAVIVLGLRTGFGITASASLTAVAGKNTYVGGVTPTALVYNVSTLTYSGTATIDRFLGIVGTGAISVAGTTSSFFDMEGGLIVPPGAFVDIYTSTAANTAGFLASFVWEEVPL